MAFNLFDKNSQPAKDAPVPDLALSKMSNVAVHTMPKSFLHKKTGGGPKNHGLGLVILLAGTVALLAIFAVLYIYLTDANPGRETDLSDAGLAAPDNMLEEAEQPADRFAAPEESYEPEALGEQDGTADDYGRAGAGEDGLEDHYYDEGDDYYDDEGDYDEPGLEEYYEPEEAEAPALDSDTPAETPLIWQLGPDSNNDGLSDKEKELLGLNKDIADFDGDGYDDFSELFNMYNPAGDGRISAHPRISRYYNSTYLYSFYYPNPWAFDSVDGDDSVMFKVDENQFVQVIVIGNADNLSLDEWHARQFDQADIKPENRVYKAGWQGIRANNGLIYYLQKTGQKNIFTLSYNLGLDNVWHYKSLFEFILKSFETD